MSTKLDCLRELEIAVARERMASAPLLVQAEIIARHYRSLEHTAHTLLALVEMTRGVEGPCDTANECAQQLIDEIKGAHARDLGIALDWSNTEVSDARNERSLG